MVTSAPAPVAAAVTRPMFYIVWIWSLMSAVQDYHAGKVSNWLTLPALGAAIIGRLMGSLTTSWMVIVLGIAVPFVLWHRGLVGGADAKAWMLYAFLGKFYILSSVLGVAAWLLAAHWSGKHQNHTLKNHDVPLFPGFVLGLTFFWFASKMVVSGVPRDYCVPCGAFFV